MRSKKQQGAKSTRGGSSSKFLLINVVIVILMAINSATLGASSGLMGKIIDSIGAGDRAGFFQSLFLNAIATALGLAATAVYYRLIFYNIKEKVLGIKEQVLRKDLTQPGWENVDYTTNIEFVYDNRYLAVYDAVSYAITFVVAFTILLATDWRALLIGFVAGLLPIISPIVTHRPLKRYSQQFREKSQMLQHYVFEHLEIRDEISRYGVEDPVERKFRKKNEEQEDSRFHLRNLMMFSGILGQSLGSVSVILIYFLGGLFVFQGLFTAGDLIAIAQLSVMMVGPFTSLASIKAIYDSTKPIYDGFQMDKKFEFQPSKKLNGGDLVAEDIHFRYNDSSRELFDGFSHTFENGKKYLIQGESGVGKSTLASILSGEQQPDSGHVYLGSTDLCTNPLKNTNIGFQNQNNKLFTGTVFDNINFYRNYTAAEIQSVMDSLHVRPTQEQLVLLNHGGLSGGERTQIAVARAMMEPREIMIFDEPTTGMNSALSEQVIDRILNLPGTVILISHKTDPEFVQRFDEVINL